MTKQITLTKGLVALVDDKDFAWLSTYRWYADVGKWSTYAKTDQLPSRPRMHALILRPPKGLYTDHIDGCGTNNQRSNLRIVTPSENARNSALRRTKQTSKYRGVSLHMSGKYSAEITLNYQKHHLGLFTTEEEAALAYNKAALELFGPGFLANVIP